MPATVHKMLGCIILVTGIVHSICWWIAFATVVSERPNPATRRCGAGDVQARVLPTCTEAIGAAAGLLPGAALPLSCNSALPLQAGSTNWDEISVKAGGRSGLASHLLRPGGAFQELCPSLVMTYQSLYALPISAGPTCQHLDPSLSCLFGQEVAITGEPTKQVQPAVQRVCGCSTRKRNAHALSQGSLAWYTTNASCLHAAAQPHAQVRHSCLPPPDLCCAGYILLSVLCLALPFATKYPKAWLNRNTRLAK